MQPENVNPRNFRVERIVFNNGSFSIAYGIWEDESNRLAMRWNGNSNDPNDVGYPKLFGNPIWFQISEELTEPLLKSLIGLNGSNLDAIFESIKINENTLSE